MLVMTNLSVENVLEILRTEEFVAIDTESNGQDVRDGRGYAIGISVASRRNGVIAYTYLPFRHSHPGNLDATDFQKVKEAIENFEGYLVFHNAKFDLVSLKTMGIDYKGKFFDTMLMCHLVNENLPMDKSLNSCVKKYVGKEVTKKNDEQFQLAVKVFGWDMPIELMVEYAAWDAAITYMLFEKIIEKFKQEVSAEYWTHKQAFTRVIIAMEGRGIGVDLAKCDRMTAIGESIMADIEEELGLNPASPKDLESLLIDRMGLPIVKETKGGKPSFDKYAMEIYEEILEARNDPTAEKILTYRGWQKTVSSNYKAYASLVGPDGRLRPNYKMHGTKTGRLSCSSPNLQQIPKSSSKEWNGDLKSVFKPTPGFSLYEADYSQLELRLATAYSKEASLAEIFEEGRDIFTEMSKGLGMTRQETKSLVYTIQYGGGINRIATIFGVSGGKASELRENFYKTYPGFRTMSNLAKNKCLADGKVPIWSGRFRHFQFRADEAHKAFNSVMQGGAADIVEDTMVRFYRDIADENCHMLLQVHDSIIFEVREGMEDEYFPRIEELMTNIKDGEFGVRFAIDIHKLGD